LDFIILNDNHWSIDEFKKLNSCTHGHLKPGTQEYKIARKLVSSKIDYLGPKAALEQAIKLKGKFLEQDSVENILEDLKEKFPHLDI
jgi:hypothetical protein